MNRTEEEKPFIWIYKVASLAWFLVDEYSGLTGRNGTTVVSVTRVLWFCVANHTRKEKNYLST